MKKTIISDESKQEIIKIINNFNNSNFRRKIKDVFYFAEFKGKFLYLKRNEYGSIAPVARLT